MLCSEELSSLNLLGDWLIILSRCVFLSQVNNILDQVHSETLVIITDIYMAHFLWDTQKRFITLFGGLCQTPNAVYN